MRIINEKFCDLDAASEKHQKHPAEVEKDKRVRALRNTEMDQTALDYFFARYGDPALQTIGGIPVLPLYRSIDDDWKSSQK